MPIIPVTRNTISTDVADAYKPNPMQGAGIVNDQLSQTASQVSQASQQLFTQLRHAEAESEVLDAEQRQKDEISEWIKKAEYSSKDGYAYNDDGSPVLNPDGSKKALTDQYKEWSDGKYRDTQTNLSSPYAQQIYRERMGKVFLGAKEEVWNKEMGFKVSYVGNLRDERLKLQANNQSTDPNPFKFYDNLDTERLGVKKLVGSYYSDNEAKTIDTKILKEQPDSLFQGYVNTILGYEMKERSGLVGKDTTKQSRVAIAMEALSALGANKDRNGNVILDPASASRRARGMPILADEMDPDKRAAWIAKFNNIIDMSGKLDKNDWIQQMNHMGESVRMNERNADGSPRTPPDVYRSMIQKGVALHSQGSLTDLELADKILEVSTLSRQREIDSTEFFFMSPRQKEAKREELINKAMTEADALMDKHLPGKKEQLGYAGVDTRKRVSEEIDRIATEADRKAKEDFPGMVIEKNPVAQEFAKTVDYSNAKNLSSPSVRTTIARLDRVIENANGQYFETSNAPTAYLSKQNAEQLSSLLNSRTQDTTQKQVAIESIFRANPKTYVAKIDQLVTEKKISPKWYLALSIPDSRAFTNQLLNAISNPVPDKEDVFAAKGASIVDVKAAISRGAEPFIQHIIARNPQSPIGSVESEAIRETLLDLTARQVVNGESPLTAANKVISSFLGERYYKVSNGGGIIMSGKSRVIPKMVGDVPFSETDKQYFQTNWDAYKTPDAVKALNPDVPKGLDPLLVPRFYENASKSLDYRMNRSGTAIVPTWIDDRTQQERDLTRNGKPIEIPLLELRKYNPKNDTLYDKVKRFIGGATSKLSKEIDKTGDSNLNPQNPPGIF
jgi:hypothetical protein